MWSWLSDGEIDQTDDALRESEQRFRRITENMLDMIAQTDLLGICEYASPSLKTVLGYDPKDMLGKSMFEYVHPDDLNNVLEIVRRALVAGTSAKFEYRYRHADGHYVWLESSGNPVLDEKGQLTGAVLSTRDITQRKQMEDAVRNSEAKYRMLFEKTPLGIYQTSLEGKLVTANPALVRLLGYDSEKEFLAVNVERDLYKNPEDRKAWMERMRTRGEVRDAELVLKRKDGEELTVLDNAHVVHDEHANPAYYEGALTDITEQNKVENALKESEEKYRAIFQGAGDGIIAADLKTQKFVFANPKICEMTGYSLNELLELNVNDFHPKQDLPFVIDEFTKQARGESDIAKDIPILRKDGTVLYCDINSRMVEIGGQKRLVGFFRDMTERKKAEEAIRLSEAKYRALVENATDLIFLIGEKGEVMSINRAATRFLGKTVEQVLGKSLFEVYPKEIATVFSQNVRAVLETGKSMTIDEKIAFAGNELWINTRLEPLLDDRGRAYAVTGVARDITERKKIEEVKDQFVSMVSHELRTPLTSIRASLGLLTSGEIGTLPEKGQRMLEIAVTNTDRLVRLINDILDSERLASGKTPMDKKRCSARQLITQALDVMKPITEKTGISLSVESQDATLWVDPDRIVQALANLISNAFKFSPKGGRIWVTAERKENEMLFRVQDEGRGIPPDKLGLLFERFQQLDSSDAREKGGSGLGLSISRSIIEQHNGKIWVESTVGKGSTFFFTIPLLLEEVPLQSEATTEAPSTGHVLIIEDDLDLANILAAMLKRHDFQPHIALTGGKGIALSKQIHPSLIVLDLILPDMDGSIVVEGLRKDNILRSVPLVVYTVKELDKQQRENLRLGETLFFTKSRIPPEQFEEKVVQFMERILDGGGRTGINRENPNGG